MHEPVARLPVAVRRHHRYWRRRPRFDLGSQPHYDVGSDAMRFVEPRKGLLLCLSLVVLVLKRELVVQVPQEHAGLVVDVGVVFAGAARCRFSLDVLA